MSRALSILPLAAVLVVGGPTSAASAPTPKQAVARAKQGWLSQLRRAARDGDSAKDFPSPPRAVLMRRLRRAQQLYRFQIVSVRMLHPLQAAPVVVIRSDRKRAIAHATTKIIEIFNPHRPTTRNPSGSAYEGFFFVAQDGRGVPYLAAYHHLRAPYIGGGEWAADDNLRPFAFP